MRRNIGYALCLALCAGVAGSWWAAGSLHAEPGLSLKTLKGDYIFALDGFTIDSGTGQHHPFAWAGQETYDGAGHVAGSFTASYAGEIVRRTYTGTYTVAADGSGSTILTDSAGDITHFDIFVKPGGDEVAYVETDPGVVSSGYERRK